MRPTTPDANPPVEVGSTFTVERSFSVEDVTEFVRISGDSGRQHIRPDPHGRLMVHGLLVATLPTQVGGAWHFLAREITYEFLRPVWTGEVVRCVVTLTALEPGNRGLYLRSTFECVNPAGEVVMKGTARGLVPGAPPSPGGQGQG